MGDKARGLYRNEDGNPGKYTVLRNDGRDAVGEKHHGCEYFVLDLTHDAHARTAAMTYAESAERDGFRALAGELRELVLRCDDAAAAEALAVPRAGDEEARSQKGNPDTTGNLPGRQHPVQHHPSFALLGGARMPVDPMKKLTPAMLAMLQRFGRQALASFVPISSVRESTKDALLRRGLLAPGLYDGATRTALTPAGWKILAEGDSSHWIRPGDAETASMLATGAFALVLSRTGDFKPTLEPGSASGLP